MTDVQSLQDHFAELANKIGVEPVGMVRNRIGPEQPV